MRMSQLFGQTLRDLPSEAEVASHQLLLRAGYTRQLAAGIFTYLPLARRSLTRIENIMRDEINAIKGQEITMPVVHPSEIWQETGRWQQIGSEMGRFKDKNGRDMVLAMTHEEVVADLLRREIRSYKQLPLLIYHIQTKWRDDPRPRAGLIRAREFTMKDSYSLDADWEGLDAQYSAHYQAYFNIFRRCGLPVIAVKSDVGMMGGKLAHEFMYLTPIGEDTLIMCQSCGYAANRQIALFRKKPLPIEPLLPITKVATPNIKTINELASYMETSASKTAKAVFMVAVFSRDVEKLEKLVFAIIRGDMEVNETKLANALGALELRPATEEEILAIGTVPGYASPIGITGAIIVADDLIKESTNLISGANEDGYHFINVNLGRDYQADLITDIAAARDGDTCPSCRNPLHTARGVEVGNIFQLGTRYSEAMKCYYQDREGNPKPIIMGSYGIGTGRLLACIAEEHHDSKGLVWPITIAPFQVHIVILPGKSQGVKNQVEDNAYRIYNELQKAGIEVLIDDRAESPGVKFNDADLIGIPIRLTVSDRANNAGGVEFKRRDKSDKCIIAQGDVIQYVLAEIRNLQEEINNTLKQERFTA